jgi:peptidoglycan-associated lipoprotein
VSRPSLPAETPIGRSAGAGAAPAGPGGAGAGGLAGTAGGAAGASPLKDVYFEYDRFTILEDQKTTLNQDAAWLKANPAVKVTIEGHCDERGTAEYNLGLGERRARAVKEYLAAAGIAANRLTTISYGKERPLVLGHDENAWKWNRRVHFAVGGQ